MVTGTRYMANREAKTVDGVTFGRVTIRVVDVNGAAVPDSGMTPTFPNGKEYPTAQTGTPGAPRA